MSHDDRVFTALADRTRRLLLDRLFERDGATLSETRSGGRPGDDAVRRDEHLRVLEAADLVVSRKAGREKKHFLNVIRPRGPERRDGPALSCPACLPAVVQPDWAGSRSSP